MTCKYAVDRKWIATLATCHASVGWEKERLADPGNPKNRGKFRILLRWEARRRKAEGRT